MANRPISRKESHRSRCALRRGRLERHDADHPGATLASVPAIRVLLVEDDPVPELAPTRTDDLLHLRQPERHEQQAGSASPRIAAEQVETVWPDGDGIEEMVGDKGYHSNQSLIDLEAVGVRSYISEPERGRRSWKKNPEVTHSGMRDLAFTMGW